MRLVLEFQLRMFEVFLGFFCFHFFALQLFVLCQTGKLVQCINAYKGPILKIGYCNCVLTVVCLFELVNPRHCLLAKQLLSFYKIKT